MAATWNLISSLVFLFAFFTESFAVDKGNFKACKDSGFCRKHRELRSDEYVHVLLVDTATLSDSATSVSAVVRNNNTQDELLLEIYAVKDRTIRIKLNEKSPSRKRYEVDMSLQKEPAYVPLKMEVKHGQVEISLPEKIQVTLYPSPFRLDIYEDGILLTTLNAQNLLLIEPMKIKPGYLPEVDDPDRGGEEEHQESENEHHQEEEKKDETIPVETWEESFKGHTDSKPFGPNSVGVDIAFIGFENVYGVPEHADSFRLRSTKGVDDPYRLYNLDVFEYELNNGMSLYGAIPFMVAHSEKTTVGMFWNNAAETWIDVDYATDTSGGSTFFGGSSTVKTDTHWFSESGLIDIFFVLGSRPADVLRQFTELVGRPFLPPFATIGYHQSRWNYNDERDVLNVHENFDEHDIPLDVIWLDIEYTDGKRYFTWDSPKFPHPAEMLKNLTKKGRNMVVISDPHIKKDDNYFIYSKMREKGYYVKNKDGKDYEGWCWPGASYYADFFNPEVRDYYASLYAMDVFKDLWTWNDMNEPSVFNGPEVTMYKDNIHYGDLEHREVHNLYGMAHILATFDGHLRRSDFKLRPFILTRSFFAGSQRLAAVWTGDNTAEWGHLKIANPMLLSLSISGMSFVGADVGGFFKNPDPQLLVRWYQAAAFQPFFRAHAHIDTRRREPWLFDDQTKFLIRDSIRARYTFLPFWYTLFFEANQTGAPMMRPLWYEFPKDVTTYPIDDEFLLGEALLVKPVTEENQKSTNIYFPGDSSENWHDITTLEVYKGGSRVDMETPINKIPVFQRGGTIIPRRFRVRRSAILGIEDPVTLSIALNDREFATGSLYLDDGVTRDHIKGDYLYTQQELKNNILESKVLHAPQKYETKVWLERIYITGFKFRPSSIEVHELESKDKRMLEFHFDEKHKILTIRKPGVNMAKDWAMIIRP